MAAGEKEALIGYRQLKQCKYTCKFMGKVIFTLGKNLKLFLNDCIIFFSIRRLSQPSTEPSMLGPLASPLLLRRLKKVRIFLHKEISLVFQTRFRRCSGFFWILQEVLKILQDFTRF